MKLLVYLNLVACSLSVKMLKLTNLYRKHYNLGELKAIPKLQMASDLQANTMCKELKLTHEGIKGRETIRDRVDAFNFVGSNVGENIAKQENDDYKEVFKLWIKSKGHRKNILGDYNLSAVTTCRGRDGNRYWVQVFGKNDDNEGNQSPTNPDTNPQPRSGGNDNSFSDLEGDPPGQNQMPQGNQVLPQSNQQGNQQGNQVFPQSNQQGSQVFPQGNQQGNQTSPQGNQQPNDPSSGIDDFFKANPDLFNSSGSNLKENLPFLKSQLLKHFSNLKNDDSTSYSIENTISISRKYEIPSTVTKTETVSQKTPTIDISNENSDNMEFLFKEGEDIKKMLKEIPPKYHLVFKGNYKKYVALKNKSSSTSAKSKTSSSTTSVKTTKTNDVQLGGMLKTILDKLKGLEKNKNELLPSKEKLTSLTIDLSNLEKTKSDSQLSSTVKPSSLASSGLVKTVTISKTQSPTTLTLFKTVYQSESKSKDEASKSSAKDSSKSSTSSVSEKKSLESINILTISDKKKESSTSIVYKTTKIGSISVLDNNSEIKTITVTVLKDSVNTGTNQKDGGKDTQTVPGNVKPSEIKDTSDSNNTKEPEDKINLVEFNSNVKKLFKDLVEKKKKGKMFKLLPSPEKDSESKLKEYVNKLVQNEDPPEVNVLIGKCDLIDIGDPVVD